MCEALKKKCLVNKIQQGISLCVTLCTIGLSFGFGCHMSDLVHINTFIRNRPNCLLSMFLVCFLKRNCDHNSLSVKRKFPSH